MSDDRQPWLSAAPALEKVRGKRGTGTGTAKQGVPSLGTHRTT
ncbi:hypothetical protein [Pseudomonas chlororaphis]|nr:hypothetical protein [Pseudomonas chlororaphis]